MCNKMSAADVVVPSLDVSITQLNSQGWEKNLTFFSGGTAALAGSAAPTAPTDGHPLGRARRAWAECHLAQSLHSPATLCARGAWSMRCVSVSLRR